MVKSVLLKNISLSDLKNAVNAFQPRSEAYDDSSKLFVDAGIVDSLFQDRNQIVYGRRGSGKTHLLYKLEELYRDSYPEKKILPIYVDAKAIADKPLIQNLSEETFIILLYRRLMYSMLLSIKSFISDEISVSKLEKIFGIGNQEKIKSIHSIINKLEKEIIHGKIETGSGRVKTAVSEGTEISQEKFIV